MGGVCAGALALSLGCAVGPDYKKPDTPAPQAYSEAGPWKEAQPKDQLPKAGWWHIFHEPTLDALEEEAARASPTLGAALARFDQAVAVARVQGSQLYPSVDLGPSAVRERFSGHRQTEYPATTFQYTTNSFDLPLQLSYEVDLFGSLRRSLESARASAEAQGAAYQGVLLVLQAGVAEDYFNLQSLVAQKELLQKNVTLLTDALELVRTLRRGGANSDLDLFQAEAELETVRSSELASERAIARALHALAVLVGQSPEGFSVDAKPLEAQVPAVPVGLPSELLERRPDIAQAERTLAAANARIGVAKAAFFPSIGLTAFGGLNSSDLNNLLKWNSREWAVGPAVSLPLFKGGANMAGYQEAKAAYAEALANYRQQVLVGFQEVEDGLSDLRLLSGEADALESAVTAASGASRLSTVRYKAGLVSYLEVIDSQRTQLADEISLTQARADRLSATVLLIQALGGGW
jgi:multidrug efflux system outer membrane protein